MSRSGPDILQKCVDAALARDLEFILIGGHAVNARGYERATFDIDFLIAGNESSDALRQQPICEWWESFI